MIAESDMLVVPMCEYHLVHGLSWFQKGNLDIDWAHRRLTSVRSPRASGVGEMTLMTMAVSSKVSKAENKNVINQLLGRVPTIQTPRATAFDDLLASDEVIAAFALWIGECPGLLGATLEHITLDSAGNTDQNAGCDEQGAAAVVAAEDLLRGDA